MKHKSLLAVATLSMLLTGCSLFSNSDAEVTPKKVQPKKAAAKKAPPAPVAKKSAQPAPGTGTATYAIDDGKSGFKVESTMPAFQGESLMPQAPQSPSTQLQSAQQAPLANAPIASVPAQPQVAVPATAITAPQVPATVATVAPAMMSINVEDAAVPSGTSPAVVALINEAERNRGRGDLDGAVTIMERALRIDSRNPTLTYKLAQLRLKQSKPQLAEDLAGKAALLAGSDLDLKRKSWLLIAEARQNQQNFQGAKDAKAKAESFFGH